jgi:hypothetical protein
VKLIEMTTPKPKETPEVEPPESNEENKQPEKEVESSWDLRMGAVSGTPITSGGDEEVSAAVPGTPITSGGDEEVSAAVAGTPITSGGDG